uniref:Uncharacterized protein n=1 Tax=Arundo donax TaxID=35708 RepID=A0A0A8Y499_ARUDO
MVTNFIFVESLNSVNFSKL